MRPLLRVKVHPQTTHTYTDTHRRAHTHTPDTRRHPPRTERGVRAFRGRPLGWRGGIESLSMSMGGGSVRWSEILHTLAMRLYGNRSMNNNRTLNRYAKYRVRDLFLNIFMSSEFIKMAARETLTTFTGIQLEMDLNLTIPSSGTGHTYIKNCEPFVFLPRLAIDSRKGRSCFLSKHSSVRNAKVGNI